MEPNNYTITRHDAKVFKDLVAFVAQDVFDERRGDGGIAKSAAFLTHIRDARGVLEQIGAYDYDHEEEDEEPGYWWSGPTDLPKDKVEYSLAKEVEGRADIVFKRAQVNLTSPSLEFADLQLAIDDTAGRVCALFHLYLSNDFNLGPDWYDIGDSLDDTIQRLVDGIETHPAWVWYMTRKDG